MLDGQREVDARLVRAQDALDSADRICAAVGGGGRPGAPGPTSSTSSTSTTAPTTTTTADDGRAGIEACRAALGTVLDAQRSVSDAQVGLAQAAAALDDLLAQRAAQASQDGADGTDGIEGGDGSTDDGSTGDGDPEATGSTSPSSADLIAYQKAVDAAEADVLVAEQAVKQATIVSPIDGTVVAVELAVGDAVEAGSSTARIVVVGPAATRSPPRSASTSCPTSTSASRPRCSPTAATARSPARWWRSAWPPRPPTAAPPPTR